MSITGDANAGLVLLAIGIGGVYAECCMPGRILPGVLGAATATAGMAALAAFPIGWPGVVLTVLSFVFFLAEAGFARRGLLTVAGTLVLFGGLKMLVDPADPAQRVSWVTAACVAVPFGTVTSFLFSAAACARRNKALGGQRYILKESESKS